MQTVREESDKLYGREDENCNGSVLEVMQWYG
jgi:hypothetical protein